MKARPVTSELVQCQRILLAIAAEIEEVLPYYLASHENTQQQHDVAEAELFCHNLTQRLNSWETERAGETGDERLAHLFSAAEQCDGLAGRLSRHRGDSRLDHALERLAECLRLTGPSVLRWAHGGRGGKGSTFLAAREKLVHQDLTSLLKSLQAA